MHESYASHLAHVKKSTINQYYELRSYFSCFYIEKLQSIPCFQIHCENIIKNAHLIAVDIFFWAS